MIESPTWSEADRKKAEQVANQLSEFMEAYILVGFTMTGGRVRIKHIVTPLQEDAIQQVMEDTIVTEFKINDPVTAYRPPED